MKSHKSKVSKHKILWIWEHKKINQCGLNSIAMTETKACWRCLSKWREVIIFLKFTLKSSISCANRTISKIFKKVIYAMILESQKWNKINMLRAIVTNGLFIELTIKEVIIILLHSSLNCKPANIVYSFNSTNQLHSLFGLIQQ